MSEKMSTKRQRVEVTGPARLKMAKGFTPLPFSAVAGLPCRMLQIGGPASNLLARSQHTIALFGIRCLKDLFRVLF